MPKIAKCLKCLKFRPRHSAWKNSCDSLAVVGLHENWTWVSFRNYLAQIDPQKDRVGGAGCVKNYDSDFRLSIHQISVYKKMERSDTIILGIFFNIAYELFLF
jgi:hypothetical protein